jgi:hypothetical protein
MVLTLKLKNMNLVVNWDLIRKNNYQFYLNSTHIVYMGLHKKYKYINNDSSAFRGHP